MNRYDNYIPEITEEDNIDSKSSSQEDITYNDSENTLQNSTNKHTVKNKEKKGNKKDKQDSQKFTFVEKLTAPGVKYFLGITLGLLGVWLLIAFISFFTSGFADQSQISDTAVGTAQSIENSAGEGGARISQSFLNDYFGFGSIVIVIWLIAISLRLFGALKFKPLNFSIKCLVALITTSLIVGLLTIGLESSFNWGGNHGLIINQNIIAFVGWSGAIILCIFLIATFVIICLNDLRVWILKLKRKRADFLAAERAAKEDAIKLEQQKASLAKIEEEVTPVTNSEEDMVEIDSTQMTFNETDYSNDITADPFIYSEETEIESEDKTDEKFNYSLESNIENTEVQQVVHTEDNPLNTTEDNSTLQMKVNVNNIGDGVGTKKQPSIYDPTAELSRYKFPPYDLLRDFKTRISVDQEEQIENKEKIRKTLLDFDIPIVSIEATVGPTVTLYEIVPDKGVRISRIRNLVDDIALSLSAIGVRIIAPIPGKGTVGIEVANKDPQTVSMRTVITSKKYQESKFELPIALGSTISNEVYIADLAKMPHLLVAGATGQGKSVGLNAIIASLLYRKHPAELKFVLIDPKMVEFSLYARLEKHYLAKLPDEEEPIITDPNKVVATLSSLCVEMDNRYALLKNASTRNIKEYNAKFTSRVLNPEKEHRFLPYIVVIVDEFSDLIMTAGKEVEIPIARIAQKARAVGIHMIIATQRPSANVITGIIRANFPARMAFKVSSGVDSKIILDTSGAQQLIGRGDMLLSNNSEMDRVQCAFIDTPEVDAICEHISKQQGYSEAYMLPEPLIDGDSIGGGTTENMNTFGDRDPLFEEIARKIVNGNTASTSSLQRHYSIGYNRAGKIMDQMEAAGIVGPAQGGKPRAVLVDPITLESILNG